MAKVGIYKKGAESGMTPEQEVKFDKLIEMGWKDVAGAWFDHCGKENETDEFKQNKARGNIAGVGMERDFEDED